MLQYDRDGRTMHAEHGAKDTGRRSSKQKRGPGGTNMKAEHTQQHRNQNKHREHPREMHANEHGEHDRPHRAANHQAQKCRREQTTIDRGALSPTDDD